jgi:hypothetical protein
MKKLIAFLSVVFVATAAEAQVKKEAQVFVQAGVKAFSSKTFNSSVSLSPSFVPMLGGGALWQLSHWQVGVDFSYLDGKKDTDEFGSILTGINANILGGYRWDISDRVKLSLQSGFGYSLHHLAVTYHHYQGSNRMNSTIYHNMVISVPVSVWLQRVSDNGLFTGVRLGYNVDVGVNEWRYIEGTNTEVYTSAADGFYFQLVFGGIIKLRESKP